MSNQEKAPQNPEQLVDTSEMESLNHERRETLRDSLEKAEKEHEKATKESVSSLKQEALARAEKSTPLDRVERSPAEKRGLITRRSREQSFKKQLDGIQPDLSRSERLLSRLIHAKSVENASDVAGATVARPNAMLAGSVCAFLVVAIVYLSAKYYGYPLSGFETIGAFGIGWLIGLVYDYLRNLIAGNTSK